MTQTRTVEKPAPPLSRLDAVIDRINQLDSAIGAVNKRITTEGRSFALLAEQRDLIQEWDVILDEYAQLKCGEHKRSS